MINIYSIMVSSESPLKEARHPCKLCSALLASGFVQSCLPNEAQFTQDKRICDSCLANDFSASRIDAWKLLLARVFYLGSLPAFMGGFWLLRRFGVHGWSRLMGAFALAVAACAVVTGTVYCVVWLYVAMSDQRDARKRREEEALEAERFYYLALWAGLTNHPAYGRRMLARAKRSGFSELSRLNDLPGARPVI